MTPAKKGSQCQNTPSVFFFFSRSSDHFLTLLYREALTAIYLLIDIHIYKTCAHCPSIWVDLHSQKA